MKTQPDTQQQVVDKGTNDDEEIVTLSVLKPPKVFFAADSMTLPLPITTLLIIKLLTAGQDWQQIFLLDNTVQIDSETTIKGKYTVDSGHLLCTLNDAIEQRFQTFF